MNKLPLLLLSCLVLSGCAGFALSSGSRVEKDYAVQSKACEGVANSRLGLYAKPDTYPMSDKEKSDAYYALFDACMHERGWDIAQDRPRPEPPKDKEKEKDTADLAKLSPASGGGETVSTVAPGVSVIDTGAAAHNPNTQRPTVVVVQSPTPASASSSPYSFFFNNNPAPQAEEDKQAATPIPEKPAAPGEPPSFVSHFPHITLDDNPAPPKRIPVANPPESMLTPAPRPPAANPDTMQLEQILSNTQ